MKISMQLFGNFRITARFILWFLVVALVPLAIAISISYNSSRKILEAEVAKNLVALADNKANQIEGYLKEKQRNAAALAELSDIIDIIDKLGTAQDAGGAGSAEYIAVEQEYRPLFTYYQRSFGFDDLVLIRQNGDIIFSVSKLKKHKSLYEVALYEESRLAKLFIKTIQSPKMQISDFEYDAGEKKASALITAPVFNGSDLIGVFDLQMSNEGISKLVGDYTGLGSTGEMAMASKIGGETVFVTPLRFDPEAAFNRKIDAGSEEGAIIDEAVKGGKALGVFVDYRGKEVMAMWRYLADFRLGMVVKMDTDEIFVSANRLRDTLFIIGAALLALVVIMATVIARTISGPIKELTRVSGVISGGDLSARAGVSARDEIGELARSFNQMTDNLVEAKASVEEQKRLLEKANRELDSFVYTVSHDLRAPLRGIVSFANFLEEDYKERLGEEGRGHLKEIRDGTKRMEDLINDLLTLSRISRIQNPYEEVDINALLSSIIERIEFDIKTHKVDMRVQENIPLVKCDRIKLQEVFFNLINNAIKFSSKNNKEDPKVEISYVDDSASHKFCVKDNGIGIAPEYHKKIFEIFRRLHTAEEYEGTGAGLSIVKKVIDDHGGDIWVESEPGKGAAFCFTIPKDLKVKKKLGRILVEDGLITEEQLREKLKEQGVVEPEREEVGDG